MRQDVKSFFIFSIVPDESTDINDIHDFFICNINENFNMTGDNVDMVP